MKKLFFLTLLVAGIAACKSGSDAAFRYNEYIVEKDNKLQAEEQVVEDKVGIFYNQRNYDSITMAGEHMEKLMQKTIDEINAKPVPDAKGVEEFKAAVLKYFTFRKGIYTVYIQYGRAETEEKRTEIENIRNELVGQRDAVTNEMQDAQIAFSKANGFKMK